MLHILLSEDTVVFQSLCETMECTLVSVSLMPQLVILCIALPPKRTDRRRYGEINCHLGKARAN